MPSVETVAYGALTQGSRWAGADVLAHQVDAAAPVLAGVRPALVYFGLAVVPLVSRHALCGRNAQLVRARLRWIVSFTIYHLPEEPHLTGVTSHVRPAGGAVEAGFLLAVVHLALAVAADVVRLALAVVRVPRVHAVATVVAELVGPES